jgi:hypothetical protein
MDGDSYRKDWTCRRENAPVNTRPCSETSPEPVSPTSFGRVPSSGVTAGLRVGHLRPRTSLLRPVSAVSALPRSSTREAGDSPLQYAVAPRPAVAGCRRRRLPRKRPAHLRGLARAAALRRASLWLARGSGRDRIQEREASASLQFDMPSAKAVRRPASPAGAFRVHQAARKACQMAWRCGLLHRSACRAIVGMLAPEGAPTNKCTRGIGRVPRDARVWRGC